MSASLDHLLLVTATSEHKTPEIKTMDKLPIVNRPEGFLVGLTATDHTSQMHSKHTNVTECMGVRDFGVKLIKLCRGILHEVDGGKGVCRGKSERR